MAAIRLKGHEKFHLREGWITKGLYGVDKNPKVFTGNEGTDQLGVGTNMVKSIKYWMLAMGLIGEEQKNGAKLTELGKLIFKYDAYLEDDLTLWLLHSYLAKNAFRSTVWYLFFNKCQADEFTKEELFILLKKELIAYAETDTFPESSLRDDIDVMLNMYSRNIVSFNLKSYKSEDLGIILDDDFGIAVRTGYHCAPFIHKWLKDDKNLGTVRVGIGKFNTEDDIAMMNLTFCRNTFRQSARMRLRMLKLWRASWTVGAIFRGMIRPQTF